MQHLCLFIADCVGLERYGRFHCGQAKQLHHVVGYHVTEGSGSIEVASTLLYTDCFRIGNLHMIDVTTVPDRLKNGVSKRKTRMFWTVSFPR